MRTTGQNELADRLRKVASVVEKQAPEHTAAPGMRGVSDLFVGANKIMSDIDMLAKDLARMQKLISSERRKMNKMRDNQDFEDLDKALKALMYKLSTLHRDASTSVNDLDLMVGFTK